MGRITQIHHPDFSLWQSAIDRIAAQDTVSQTEGVEDVAPEPQRPDTDHPMVNGAADAALALESGVTLADDVASGKVSLEGEITEGVVDTTKYCASIWWEIAKARIRGDKATEAAWKARLGAFGSCDPRYAEAVTQFEDYYKIKKQSAPYVRWKNLSDFIIPWQIPAKARIVILGDWGTGQPDAKALLKRIANTNPDIIFHLGDIYYSGTAPEVDNYFWSIWQSTIDTTKVKTFTLAGNHDMYSGGVAYYDLLKKVGQPASYFCLRNDDWQFIAMDTGLNDVDALKGKPTFLDPQEVVWIQDKIDTAGARQTVLMSHHQLFTAFEDIGGTYMNKSLNTDLGSRLPKVTAWFWGHEHNQVIYKPYMNVLGRCIGHGAYPVGITEIEDTPKQNNVPLEDVRLTKGLSFYSHGYVVMDIDGRTASVNYYQDSDPENKAMFTETLGKK